MFKDFHSKLVSDLDPKRFQDIFENLNHQIVGSENVLVQKASNVEHLVLMLQVDELKELKRA